MKHTKANTKSFALHLRSDVECYSRTIKQIRFRTLLAEFFVLFLVPLNVLSQETPRESHLQKKEDNSSGAQETTDKCVRFRAKRQGAVVYEKPDSSSKQAGRLAYGEYVCVIGQEKAFAVVDWSRRDAVNERPASAGEKNESEDVKPAGAVDQVYVPLADLQPSYGALDYADPELIMEKAKIQMQRMRFGGMPEDGLAPYRPLLRPFTQEEPACRAGKICEKVK